MKRSDMVKLIAGWIESNNNKFLDYEEIAKEVLLNIELCGMLPPSTKLSHISTVDNAWEPEDG